MIQTDIFVIEYKLHGEQKSFIIRAKEMRNLDAWQWVSYDAGLAPIPNLGRPPLKVVSKPHAERLGVTELKWREAAAPAREEAYGPAARNQRELDSIGKPLKRD